MNRTRRRAILAVIGPNNEHLKPKKAGRRHRGRDRGNIPSTYVGAKPPSTNKFHSKDHPIINHPRKWARARQAADQHQT